jgi:hypothetical protein
MTIGLFRFALGISTDNTSMSIALGLAIGVAFGAIFDFSNSLR